MSKTTIAGEFARMKGELEEAQTTVSAYETFIIDMLGLEEGAALPEDPKTALAEKMAGMRETIATLTDSADAAEQAQASAVEAAEEARDEAHRAKLEEIKTAHNAELEDLRGKLDAAETLAEERGKKLKDPAYEMASIPGQEPVETGTGGEDAETPLYTEYRVLKESDPVQATLFWRENEAAIKAELRTR